MKIKEIYIKGFGKISNQKVHFSDGINLIYGNNEAGKSTIHKFIESVLFGMYKQYTKKKTYSEDYNKYLPWNSNNYEGSITFELNNKTYVAQRVFDKNKESFKLFDNVTGQDLTNTLYFNNIIKQYSINNLLNTNYSIFKNTMSVKQLSSKTDESLAKELKDILSNFEQGATNDISINLAIKSLENQKKLIGTKRQSTSNLGHNVLKLERLKQEQANILKLKEENITHYIRLKELNEKLNDLNSKKDGIRENIVHSKEARHEKIYLKYKSIILENNTLGEKIKEFSKYANISKQMYEEVITIEGKLNLISKDIESLSSKEENVKNQINAKTENINTMLKEVNNGNYEKILSDIEILQDRLDTVEKLNKKLVDKKDINIEKNYVKKGKRSNLFSTITVCAAFATFALGVFSLTISPNFKMPFYISGAFSVFVIILNFLNKHKLNKTHTEFEKYDTSIIRTSNMIELNYIDINKLLDEYSEKDPKYLLEKLKSNLKFAKEITETKSNISNLESVLGQIDEHKSKLNLHENTLSERLSKILSDNDISNIDEFRQAIDKSGELRLLYSKLEDNKKLMNNIEEQVDIKSLQAKYSGNTTFNNKVSDVTYTQENLNEINDEISSVSNMIARINGIVEKSDESLSRLEEINENINICESLIYENEYNLQALDKAIDGIKSISSNIHLSVASNINEEIASIVKKITNNKYKDIKVSEDMNISVFDEESSKIVGIESLSKGTIDQVYLALRLSIMDSILKQKNMPIILDECFTQYDDIRFENICEYLNEIAKNRQIILFSSQKRELELFQRKKVNINKILL